MNLVILGDVHLGKGMNLGKVGIGSKLNSRLVDQIKLLDWTLAQAIENNCSHIVITGDIFEDPKPSSSLITIFISWLKQCTIHYVNVHLIRGNHDFLRNGTVYNSPLDIIGEMDLDTIHIYNDITTISIDNTSITFIPFRDRKSFNVASGNEAIELIRGVLSYELSCADMLHKKVIIGHLAIEGSIPVGDEIDDMTNELFCPLNLFSGYDYVWMGHVHKPQVMQKVPYVAHIGSMDISNFGETDHKKHIILFDTVNHNWEKVTIPTRQLKKISISIPKDEDPTNYVLSELAKNKFDNSIVKVEITTESETSVNKSIIDQYLMSSGAFNVNTISESKKVSLIKRDINNTINTNMDVSSAIKTYAHAYVDEDARSNFIELAMDIYKELQSS